MLDAVIKTVLGDTGITDNVLTKGNNEISHEEAVLSLLKAAKCSYLKLNTGKIWFKTKECKFFGQLFTQEGMSINPKKVSAIRQMDAPEYKKQLESFQGMVNYQKCYSS